MTAEGRPGETGGLRARPARREDAQAICEIYNQGIEDRIATFETEPRTVADIAPWFEHAHGFVAVVDGVWKDTMIVESPIPGNID
jgi:L-amino acid N-acyltransferase YncA